MRIRKAFCLLEAGVRNGTTIMVNGGKATKGGAPPARHQAAVNKEDFFGSARVKYI